MNEELIDKELKEFLHKIDEDKESFEVPKMFSRGIDEVLENLPNKKKFKRHSFRKAVIAAGISFIFLLGLGCTFPAFAENIPVINRIVGENSIFNIPFGGDNWSFKYNSKLKEYSTEVNQSVTDKGITVTMKEVAYDGTKLYVAYEIKGDKPLNLFENEDGKRPDLVGTMIKINGKVPHSTSRGTDYKKIDDKTYLIKEDITNSNMNTIPDKFEFAMSIKPIANIEGKWNFDFLVSQESFKNKIKKIKLDDKYEIDNDKLEFKKLILTPINTHLNLDIFTDKNEEIQNYYYNVLLFDDKGNEILNKEQNSFTDNEFLFRKPTVRNIYFAPFDNLPEYLKVKVVKRKHVPKDFFDAYHFIQNINAKTEIPLATKLPITVSTGSLGKMTINKIDRDSKKNSLKIHYTIEGDAPSIVSEYGVYLYDKGLPKNEKSSYSWEPGRAKIDSKTNEYVSELSFDRYPRDIQKENKTGKREKIKNPTIVIPNLDEEFEILKNNEIKINIKNN